MVTKEKKVVRKKTWVEPKLESIKGLDSCVEFLYGTGGTPGGVKYDPNQQTQP